MRKNNFILGAIVAGSILEGACSSNQQHLPKVRVDLSIQRLCQNQHLETQECISQISKNIQTQIQVSSQENAESVSAFNYQKSYRQPPQTNYTFRPKAGSSRNIRTKRAIPPLTSLYVLPADLNRTQSQLEINSFLISSHLSEKFECQFNQETNIVVCRSTTANLTLEEVAILT